VGKKKKRKKHTDKNLLRWIFWRQIHWKEKTQFAGAIAWQNRGQNHEKISFKENSKFRKGSLKKRWEERGQQGEVRALSSFLPWVREGGSGGKRGGREDDCSTASIQHHRTPATTPKPGRGTKGTKDLQPKKRGKEQIRIKRLALGEKISRPMASRLCTP